jgi:extradiol dioxygenase family protein
MKIDHVNIAAPMALLTEVKEFYCGALGLETGPRPGFDFRGFWLYGDGQPLVHLMESDRHPVSEGPGAIDHLGFQLEDVASYVQRLKSRNIAYRVNYLPDFHITQVFCKDPCGNGVEANFPGEQLA